MIRIICLTLLLAGGLGSSLLATIRYVAKPGTNVSGPWVGHWTTIAEVNAGTNPSDTVFFGTGIWRGPRMDVVGGSAGAPTIYACSSFAFVNGSGEYHFAKIYASQELTGWTSLGNGMYSRSGASTGPIFEGQMMLQNNSSSFLGQGEWWTDGSSETRIRLTFDRNPATTSIEETASKKKTIRVDSQDYVTLWGLDVRYGNNRNIEASFQSGSTNYINIEHCKVGPAAGDFSSNPGNIYSGATGGLHNNWTIRACSLGSVYALNGTNGTSVQGSHGASLEFYSQNFITVESCYVYGFHSHAAIYHKNDSNQPTYGNVYRYNQIQTDNDNAKMIRLYRGKRDVEIYGNIFLPHAGNGITDGPSNSGDGNHSVYNNTFIDVDEPFSTCYYEGSTRKIDLRFKYNVVYHSGTVEMNVTNADIGNPSGPTVFDNNLYYANGYTWSSGGCGGQSFSNMGLSGWQNEGWDVNSVVLSAGSNDFSDLAGGDYARSTTSIEMDSTYGGQRWTKFGAVQIASNDQGVRDTTRLEVASVSPLGNDIKITLELWLYHDVQDLASAGVGFSWLSSNLIMDSSSFTSLATSGFDGSQSLSLGDDIAQTNANKQFHFSGMSSSGNSLSAGSVAQHVASYWMTYSNWTAADSIVLDTALVGATNLVFVGTDSSSWFPRFSGQVSYFDPTDVNDDFNNLPSDFVLAQNYPNPFNPSTTIRFTLPLVSDYDLAIYNILGQAVDEFNGTDGPGEISITWNAANNPSGVYFYRLQADSFIATRKMVLLK